MHLGFSDVDIDGHGYVFQIFFFFAFLNIFFSSYCSLHFLNDCTLQIWTSKICNKDISKTIKISRKN